VYESQNGSFFVSPSFQSKNLKYGIIIVRDPLSRLVSSFLDGMHTEGMPLAVVRSLKARQENMSSSTDPEDPATVRRRFEDYSQHPHFIGCQVKMLNGFECASAAPLVVALQDPARARLAPQQRFGLAPFNSTLLQTAIERLRAFFFVGVFEQYPRSLALLHRAAGGLPWTSPHPLELSTYRSTDRATAAELWRQGWSDPYDGPLHREAVRLLQLREDRERDRERGKRKEMRLLPDSRPQQE